MKAELSQYFTKEELAKLRQQRKEIIGNILLMDVDSSIKKHCLKQAQHKIDEVYDALANSRMKIIVNNLEASLMDNPEYGKIHDASMNKIRKQYYDGKILS